MNHNVNTRTILATAVLAAVAALFVGPASATVVDEGSERRTRVDYGSRRWSRRGGDARATTGGEEESDRRTESAHVWRRGRGAARARVSRNERWPRARSASSGVLPIGKSTAERGEVLERVHAEQQSGWFAELRERVLAEHARTGQ